MPQLKVKDNGVWVDIPAGGVGVPSGGTTGQVLQKSSNTDYATEWATPKSNVIFEVIGNKITPNNGTYTLSKSVAEFDFVIVAVGWGDAQTAEKNFVITPLQYTSSEVIAYVYNGANCHFYASFSGNQFTISSSGSSGYDPNQCVRVFGCKIG